MINPPPDPVASLEAEQRSEDDGMPEHPAKAADPVAWADTHVEREKEATLGYPSSPLGQALVDVQHSVAKLFNRVRRPVPAASLTLAAGVGAGVAAYFLFMRNGKARFR